MEVGDGGMEVGDGGMEVGIEGTQNVTPDGKDGMSSFP